uniref:DNA polymerase kappa n=1 Tax=Panagrellus redivivus TaxID=6233 RepID=A0A7E4W1H0_PANRE
MFKPPPAVKVSPSRPMEPPGSSLFNDHAADKRERLKSNVGYVKSMISRATPAQQAKNEKEFNDVVADYKTLRNLKDYCVHVDLDAFYAQVECLREPKYTRLPMAVGGDSMLSTANYPARKFGVKSGMPGFQAKKLCPQLVILPCDFKLYHKASWSFHQVLSKFDPDVRMAGLDEAYLNLSNFVADAPDGYSMNTVAYDGECQCNRPRKDDITEDDEVISSGDITCTICGMAQLYFNCTMNFSPGIDGMIRMLRMEVAMRTNLSCSAGIASSYYLAKVCSDINKPNGQFILPGDNDALDTFILSSPLKLFPGIGPTSSNSLAEFGIKTVADLLNHKKNLRFMVSNSQYYLLTRIVAGVDCPPDETEESTNETDNGIDSGKTVGTESTFTPTSNQAELVSLIRSFAKSAIESAKGDGVTSVGILFVKVKLGSYDVHTCSQKFNEQVPLTNVELLQNVSETLLTKFIAKQGKKDIRLLGVRYGELGMAPLSKVQTGLKSFLNKPTVGGRCVKRRKLEENTDPVTVIDLE